MCLRDIYEVKYSEGCPHFPISLFMKIPIPLFEDVIPLLTSKHKNWQHEKEWRYSHNASDGFARYRMDSLREIIIGARAKPEDPAMQSGHPCLRAGSLENQKLACS